MDRDVAAPGHYVDGNDRNEHDTQAQHDEHDEAFNDVGENSAVPAQHNEAFNQGLPWPGDVPVFTNDRFNAVDDEISGGGYGKDGLEGSCPDSLDPNTASFRGIKDIRKDFQTVCQTANREISTDELEVGTKEHNFFPPRPADKVDRQFMVAVGTAVIAVASVLLYVLISAV